MELPFSNLNRKKKKRFWRIFFPYTAVSASGCICYRLDGETYKKQMGNDLNSGLEPVCNPILKDHLPIRATAEVSATRFKTFV